MRAYEGGDAPMFLSEHRVQDGADGWRWMRARGRAVARNDVGRITRIAGTARDVSAQREHERDVVVAGRDVFDAEFDERPTGACGRCMRGRSGLEFEHGG